MASQVIWRAAKSKVLARRGEVMEASALITEVRTGSSLSPANSRSWGMASSPATSTRARAASFLTAGS